VLSDPAVEDLPAYRLSLDITPLTNGVSGQREGNDVGIMFLYTDADNYYRVSLNARYGYTRFERRSNGDFETLAVNSVGYIEDQPINMSVEVGADAIIVRIDGEAVFAEAAPSIPSTHTPVALYCQDRVSFDNVSVEPATLAPMISIISPLAYSIALTPDDGDTLLVEAVVLNQPVGGDVVITLNGERETLATGSGSHFVAQFDGVTTGDHDLAAVLRDAAGNTLDMDLNTTVGVGGDYYLTMGDSIANGVGDLFSGNNDSTDGRIVAIQGFQASLADALTTSTGRPQIVFNEGISGDRVSDLNIRVDSILERHPSANKVLLMIGTNGSSGNTDDPDLFQAEVEAIVDKVDILAGKQLWLAKTLPTYLITDPATLDQARNLIIGQFNAKIAAIADANLEDNTFLGPDFFDTFTTLADPLFYFSDYLHPSDNGYQVMADEWHTVLAP
jgi:lysophospholipase L1-like esterase